MALPSNADVVVVFGYWWDEVTGLGVKNTGGSPATITLDPIALDGTITSSPNVRDISTGGFIKTRQRVATIDAATAYFAVFAVASNDPDLDAYGGRRVTLSGEKPFDIEIPWYAPLVTVDAPMAAATGLTQGVQVKALPLSQAAVLGVSTPTPVSAYLSSGQTLSAVASGIGVHDTDPRSHADIRLLSGVGPAVALTDAATITTNAAAGRFFTVTLGGNRTLADPTGLTDGQRYMWLLKQDVTGGRTITLGPSFNVNQAVTGPIVLSPTPNKRNYLGAIYSAASNQLDVIAFGPNF